MEPQESSVIVRLLIFSGRPDPEWTLEGEARDQLLARVREARGKEETNAPPVGGLGYRGFLITPTRPAALDLPELRVFRGVLSVGAGPKAPNWRDVTGVEDLLLNQAREKGFGDALEVFGAGRGGAKSPAS